MKIGLLYFANRRHPLQSLTVEVGPRNSHHGGKVNLASLIGKVHYERGLQTRCGNRKATIKLTVICH